MDTTEQYIKMRLGAIPDLGEGIPLETGRDIEDEPIEPCWVTSNVFIDTKGDFYWADGIYHCQLERQDQLQEMVGGYEAGFIDWFYWRNAVYPHMQNPFSKEWRFTSYEQLWLAFVMKEKYNKVWDGEEWVE